MNCSLCADLFIVAASLAGDSCECMPYMTSMQRAQHIRCDNPNHVVNRHVIQRNIEPAFKSDVFPVNLWSVMNPDQLDLYSRSRTNLVFRIGGEGDQRPLAGVYMEDGSLVGSAATQHGMSPNVIALIFLPKEALSTETTRSHFVTGSMIPSNTSSPVAQRG